MPPPPLSLQPDPVRPLAARPSRALPWSGHARGHGCGSFLAWLAAALFALAAAPACAGEVQVAVAANFAAPVQEIAAGFTRETGHKVVVIVGATGQLYAQIRNGAPFEVFLAADAQTPGRLEEEGRIVPGHRQPYATGRLVLYSAQPGFVNPRGEVLRSGPYAHLALADPKTAPYGLAAREALEALGLWNAVQARIVMGESIAQAFQFVATGNAELGFVALSQVAPPGHPAPGSWWIVPEDLYHPIRQEAVLLRTAAANPVAAAFFDYLRSPAARTVIRSYGYRD